MKRGRRKNDKRRSRKDRMMWVLTDLGATMRKQGTLLHVFETMFFRRSELFERLDSESLV